MCLPVKPYKVEREWKAFGLSCAVVMNREAGNRCGYVRVPPGHVDHGKDYAEVDVDVHGGLTFSEIEPCTEHEDGQGWWLGFDCGHFQDAMYDPSAKYDDPNLSEETRQCLRAHKKIRGKREDGHYWTQPEVELECERMAAQLAQRR